MKWLEMQRHALSSIQLNRQNYQAPYSVYRDSLSQFQASNSSHVRMPICTPGSSNTVNDDESLRMPTKVSYGPNNLHSRIIKCGESSKLQNIREPEEDFMTDESSEPTGDSGESQKEQETPQFQWTKKQVSKLLELYADEKFLARFRDKITKKKQVWSDLAAALNKDLNIHVSGDQCDVKVRKLKKRYHDCEEHNKKTGVTPKYCEHYNQLDEIFQDSETINPKVLHSSLRGKDDRKRAGKGKERKATDVNHGEDYVKDEDNEENEEPKGKKRLRRSPESTAETFKTYVEERRQDNQLMLDSLEKMHNEETVILGSFLNIFKELVKKIRISHAIAEPV